jgi:replication-associated recombination protein RarA
MSKTIKDNWAEKYRPQTIDDLITSDRVNSYFTNMKATGEITQHILLIGSYGIGKTSLAKMVPNDILDCEYMYVNASDKTSIEDIRTNITRYVETGSFDGKKKIVILDEAGGLSFQAQEMLNNIMEENVGHVIFILTTNHSHKITGAVKSRCVAFDMSYTTKEYVKRILTILKDEGITFDKSVVPFIQGFFPDIRECLNDLQSRVIDGVIDVTDAVALSESFVIELWDKIYTLSIHELHKLIIESESQFNNDYFTLGNKLFQFVCESDIDNDRKSKILIVLGDAIGDHPTKPDAEINMFTAILRIRELQ